MKQATPNCFPAYLTKDVCKEVLSKCYLTVHSSSPQADVVRDLSTALRLSEANNQVGETLFKKKKAKIHPHIVITVNRNLVSSGGNQHNE